MPNIVWADTDGAGQTVNNSVSGYVSATEGKQLAGLGLTFAIGGSSPSFDSNNINYGISTSGNIFYLAYNGGKTLVVNHNTQYSFTPSDYIGSWCHVTANTVSVAADGYISVEDMAVDTDSALETKAVVIPMSASANP